MGTLHSKLKVILHQLSGGSRYDHSLNVLCNVQFKSNLLFYFNYPDSEGYQYIFNVEYCCYFRDLKTLILSLGIKCGPMAPKIKLFLVLMNVGKTKKENTRR